MSGLVMVMNDGETGKDELAALSTGLLAHHAKIGYPRKPTKFNIFLKDGEGIFWGGVICTCLWNGMEIDSLWVDESMRGQGWGKKLMEAAETEGKKRGCTFAYTNTFTWQAPGFYKKLGYTEYGRLGNFPEGNCLTYIRISNFIEIDFSIFWLLLKLGFGSTSTKIG